jgi:pyochelin biosynthesis protein PchC
MSKQNRRTWVRRLGTVADPVARMVCFPHSGGAAETFSSWAALMPPRVELLAVQYPARGDRFTESPMADVVSAARAAAEELRALEPLDTVFFGHSLGALVAYEAALAARDRGAPPCRLVVSGCAAPQEAGGGGTHLLPDAELWAAVCAFGTVDADLAGNAEFRDLVLPALRADIAANETYRPAPDAEPLPCPLDCYYSPEDELASGERLRAWSGCTTAGFALHPRPGGHFHLRVDTAQLIDAITSAVLGRQQHV